MLNSPFGISSKFRFSFSTRYFIIDFPIGWPEFFSTIANVFKNSFLLDLSHIKISTTSGVPLVIVPVLSKQIVVTLANSSMTTHLLLKLLFLQHYRHLQQLLLELLVSMHKGTQLPK